MITSRAKFIEYCLRRLGSPVVSVNVTDEQLSDRLDDVLHKFKEFHYNGTQRTYLPIKVTQTDINNKYVNLPEEVVGVIRVLPYSGGISSSSSSSDSGLFSAQYQMRVDELWNMKSGNMAYYEMAMQNLTMMDQLFNGTPIFRYTSVVDKLYIDGKWGAEIKKDMWIVIECFVTTDPTEYIKIWNETWVKDYFTALVKLQWGTNMKKFQNILTIGGATIDGQGLYDEAQEELAELEQELRNTYEEPVNFIMG